VTRIGTRFAAAAATVIANVPLAAHASDLWIGLGVSEVASVPDVSHYGVYGYAGVTLPIELGTVWLIPGLGVEVCPEQGTGGGVGSLTLERSIMATVAADLIISAVHDQPGLSWSDAVFSLGAGGGVSLTRGAFVVSPSVTVFRVVDSPAWSVAPAIAVSHEL